MVPYNPNYIRELLPEQYKRDYQISGTRDFNPKKRLFDVWSIAEPPKAPLF
jgi:hypothetical protein